MSEPVSSRDIGSLEPNDLQHPKLYENAAWGLGIIAVLCVLAIAVLAILAPQSENLGAIVTGLVSVAMAAVGGLVQLFRRESK